MALLMAGWLGAWRMAVGSAPCPVNVEILQAISYGEILGSRGSVLGSLGSHTMLGSSGASSLLTQEKGPPVLFLQLLSVACEPDDDDTSGVGSY